MIIRLAALVLSILAGASVVLMEEYNDESEVKKKNWLKKYKESSVPDT